MNYVLQSYLSLNAGKCGLGIIGHNQYQSSCFNRLTCSHSSLNYHLPDCGTMSDPTNGDVDLSNGTVYKSAAAYTCRHGYQLIGMNVLRCLANGSWDHVPPVCVIYGR